MNYRHQFHAGNFADVFKHAALVQLIRFLQRKDKGFLYLDTHAGRGRYNLAAAARGDSLERRPEWPDGIGRLINQNTSAPPFSAVLADYLETIRTSTGHAPETYPGSPWIAKTLARPQDRLVLCEKHPEEAAALEKEFHHQARVSVQTQDGYTGVRAHLPPQERRALVLIDPPFEERDEFSRVITAIQDGLRRLPGGTFAIWYPLTGRARSGMFLDELATLSLPPAFSVEISVAGAVEAEAAGISLRGCGLLVINPPWGIAPVLESLTQELTRVLAQQPGGHGTLHWLVPESH